MPPTLTMSNRKARQVETSADLSDDDTQNEDDGTGTFAAGAFIPTSFRV